MWEYCIAFNEWPDWILYQMKLRSSMPNNDHKSSSELLNLKYPNDFCNYGKKTNFCFEISQMYLQNI